MKLNGRAVRFPDPTPVKALEEIPLADKLIISLKQHAGPPARAVVEVGAEVEAGQLLAAPAEDAFDAAPVHSPVAGKVVEAIWKRDHHGQEQSCLVIEPSGDMPALPAADSLPPANLGPDGIIDRIARAGVVSSGREGEPLALELTPNPPRQYLAASGAPVARPIEALLLAAVDIEPGVQVHRRLAVAPSPALTAGLAAMKTASGAGKVIVAGDKSLDQPAWTAVLGEEDEIFILDNTKHPLGMTQVLTLAVTGRETPLPYGAPRDVGLALVRAETAYWAGLAVTAEQPQTAKWVSIIGPDGQTALALAPLGTPIGFLLKQVGVIELNGGKVIIGGYMTGTTTFDLDAPITKEIDSIAVLRERDVAHFGQDPCISCGLCAQYCPTRLMPGELSKYCEYGRFEDAEKHNLMHCIECGLCAYVCPAKRPMVHYIRHAKEELLARRAGQ